MQHFIINETEISVFLPTERQPENLVWYTFPDNLTEAQNLAQLLPHHIVVAIFERDWERHFTPWAAPRLFKKGADFGGNAAEYYAHLLTQIVPQIEQQCGFQAAYRGILAYSLAGLMAMYGAYTQPFFDAIACVSGSLWFDGWSDFAAKNTPAQLPRAIYFSLGDQEANTHNQRMAQVQIATEYTVKLWQQYDLPVYFEINQGGHFDNVAQRLARAAWVLSGSLKTERTSICHP
ncbi:hypothetical protein MIS45_06675 [Wielerella bovis]|uniref:alpha/beta hydrolase n=1 Tax=Wielerella bovis TaxID=2917790 RepID=UPI002019FB92|nr:alpha/beta hydrolase-fold protein [Wielerella bovis]ULJ68489.1 hypothetical protein MIS45_06675 [Wielerella bovis]